MYFEVKMPNPTAEDAGDPRGTRDVNRLVVALRDRAVESGLSWPWYVLFVPEHDDPQADDDEAINRD